MSIHALSHHRLIKERKHLEAFYQTQDWSEFKRLDPLLMSLIKQASDDPHRNIQALLREIQIVVALYGKMTSLSRQQAFQSLLT